MRYLLVVAVAAAFLNASPALADKYFAVTPSGAAEMLFPEKPQAVVGKLSSKCIDTKWTVISSTSTELVCEAPLNFGQALVGQMLMGNSYSTPPRRFFRFNVAEVQGISRVQASGWMELQMAFGQIKRTDFSGPEFQNSILLFMAAAGGSYPQGTTFPNHAAMGVQVDNAPQGKLVYFRIKEVSSGSAADKAGIRVGDIITAIAGKQFKTYDDYFDATAKAATKPTYEVALLRDGKAIKISVERAFRPAWTASVEPAPMSIPPANSSGTASSVADELTKLLKLKEAGALTEAEFDAQKKKLLNPQ